MDALEPDANDNGSTDLGFWELYTRWLQYAAFLPMFRSHGTDVPREIWRFGDEGSPFYDAIAACIRLRYRLLPYIYSLAAAVTLEGKAMIRALALEFPNDSHTHDVTDEFLFGPSLLVCAGTEPMYYGPNSQPLTGVLRRRRVYLPDGRGWFEFWSGKRHDSGQVIEAEATLEHIPLFVRAGSILPMAEPMQFVDEARGAPYELRVYTGDNASFELYEDAGDGYAYERGEYALVRIEWDESVHELLMKARRGDFPEIVREREYRILFVTAAGAQEHSLIYRGEEIRLRIDEVNRCE